jgi:hypothetical protein
MLPLAFACSSSSGPPSYAPPIVPRQSSQVELWVDGVPFRVKSCSAGSPSGFLGFELSGEDGSRLRITSELDGSSKVVVFRPGAERGVTLLDCSRAEMKESRGRSSTSVRGRASIKCDDQGVRVEGTVLYERC